MEDSYRVSLPDDESGSSTTFTILVARFADLYLTDPCHHSPVSRQFDRVLRQAAHTSLLHEVPRRYLMPAASSDIQGGRDKDYGYHDGEFVRNILDNGREKEFCPNKWFTEELCPVRVGVRLSNKRKAAVTVAAYAVRFADSHQNWRDPTEWTVVDASPDDEMGRDGGADGTTVLHRVNIRDPEFNQAHPVDPYEWRVYPLPTPVLLEHGFTLVVADTGGDGGGQHGVQLAQIALVESYDDEVFDARASVELMRSIRAKEMDLDEVDRPCWMSKGENYD